MLNNCQLQQHEGVKYRGLHLDQELNWEKHILTTRK